MALQMLSWLFAKPAVKVEAAPRGAPRETVAAVVPDPGPIAIDGLRAAEATPAELTRELEACRDPNVSLTGVDPRPRGRPSDFDPPAQRGSLSGRNSE
jgi:hypothetical protein